MRKDPKQNRDARKAAMELLHRLSSADAGPAWSEFLDIYAPLIMKAALQFEYRQDRSNDCFVYVCEQLNDNGFRRLLKFNTAGKAKFETWLGTVVFNLCVDWHRREFGRVTLLPAISALPAFDRAVYRLVIEQNLSKEESFQTLRGDFPDLTRELVERSVLRVYSLISPKQRWQIAVRNRSRRRTRANDSQWRLEQIPEPGSGPEENAQLQQDLDSLKTALGHLPARERLLLYMRFQQGLSLKKIAELAQLGDSSRAWRQIQASIDALLRQIKTLQANNFRKKR